MLAGEADVRLLFASIPWSGPITGQCGAFSAECVLTERCFRQPPSGVLQGPVLLRPALSEGNRNLPRQRKTEASSESKTSLRAQDNCRLRPCSRQAPLERRPRHSPLISTERPGTVQFKRIGPQEKNRAQMHRRLSDLACSRSNALELCVATHGRNDGRQS